MKFKLLTLSILLVIFVSSAWGFNGERNGFVLGGGLGFAPIITTSVASDSDTKAGFGFNFLIGHAWDDHNMIVYEGNASGYVAEYSNRRVITGFDGFGWYHYFGTAGKSAYTIVGVGVYQYLIEEYEANASGFAILLGGGFEFSRHWQIGGYFLFGKTSRGSLDYDHSNFNLLISTVAF